MFIGSQEIESEKTLKNGFIQFSYKEKKVKDEVFSKDVLKEIKTKDKIDDTSLREKRCVPVINQILAILLEKNIYLVEVEHIFRSCITSFQKLRNRAEDGAWGCDEYKKTYKQMIDLIQ